MSDTTITPEERAEIRRRFEILRRGHPITGSFSLGVHMDGYLRNYAHGFEVNFIGLLDALEAGERLRVHDSRFWRHVDDSGDCWEWKGTKDRKGYGQFTVNKKHFFAHRWAYEALVGPIAEGMVVDHLCRNRACCNPSHMEIVTPVENVKRGEGITAQNSRKDKCQCGQPYFIAHRKDGRSYRYCRACKNEYQRRWRAS